VDFKCDRGTSLWLLRPEIQCVFLLKLGSSLLWRKDYGLGKLHQSEVVFFHFRVFFVLMKPMFQMIDGKKHPAAICRQWLIICSDWKLVLSSGLCLEIKTNKRIDGEGRLPCCQWSVFIVISCQVMVHRLIHSGIWSVQWATIQL
jgi:hypothetical protein